LFIGETVLAASAAGAVGEPGEKGVAIAFAARVAGDVNRTRLVVDFDRSVGYELLLLENPNRVVIDLSETVFSFSDKKQERLRGLVTDFRYGSIAPGRSRIVLLTSAPTRIEKSTFAPLGDKGRFRLKLDIVKTDQQSYRNAIFLQSDAFGKSGNVAHKGDRIKRGKSREKSKFTVVIDPGHGGIDGGAEGQRRTIEKSVTLGFALALKRLLEEKDLLRVLMTREKDVFVSLDERVGFARRNQADLLISIHADSLALHRIRGATIYTLSAEGSDELARQTAENENRSDLIAGLALPEKNLEVADILIELTRRETKLFSTRFATVLVSHLKGRIPLIKNPKRDANFHVLRAPEVPSVLLELGYLSNLKDEQQMNSPKWQETTAAMVRDAIIAHFLPRIARGG
jgi:N-acetylmuramoyl-L-alanine amidase